MVQENLNISDLQYFNLASNQAFTLSELVEAGKKYPYSLPVQATLARVLKQSKPIDYEKFVKISAVLSPDRQWLYDFLQLPSNHVKKELKSQAIISQEIKAEEENRTSSPENKTVIITPKPPIETFVETDFVPESPIISAEPIVLVVDEVNLPQPQIPVNDDGNAIIAEALQKLGPFEQQKEPEVQPGVKKEVVSKPIEPLITAKNDLLEREILKEAIDKSIQKEVGEIQVDFKSVQQTETESTQEEQNPSGFQYWLNPSRKKAESREEKLKKIDALIEKFIKSEPRIAPKKSEFFSPVNVAKQSVAVDENLVSEPLALIFEKQGYFDKAIKAYEKLSLKIPEKRAYFATRIEKIKEIVRNIKNNKE